MSQPTWAIATDLSEVIETSDGFGAFPTELDALNRQIILLKAERAKLQGHIAVAHKRLRDARHRRRTAK